MYFFQANTNPVKKPELVILNKTLAEEIEWIFLAFPEISLRSFFQEI